MGNTSEKPLKSGKTLPPPKRPSPIAPPLPNLEKDSTARFELCEAIKKRDIILFKRTLQNYNVKPTDVIGPPEQRKTVLHRLAESNFGEGMKLILDLMASQKPEIASKILNVKDSDGNTPLLLCCLANSVETLEVLARDSHVDMEAKNAAKKTALEIAIEMESPCVNVLTSVAPGSMASTKNTVKSSGTDSLSQNHSLEETWKISNTDKDLDSLPGSQGSIGSKEMKELKDPISVGISVRLPEVLAVLDARETNFEDSEFPHEIDSLESEENVSKLMKKYSQIKWKRPSEFMDTRLKETTLFSNFLLGNISNSPLVGCEVYSAIAAIAEYPQRLSRVFISKEVTKAGVYALKFTVAGRAIEILLDDYFPCVNGSNLVYSRPEGNELWFLFLEKAFAKLYGSYSELINVEITDAIEILTGMPVAQILLQNANEDKLWRKLLDYDKKNYILCAGEPKRPSNSLKNRVFTIVNMFECNEHRLLKIRNHFGHFAWKGDFSANSPIWTRELKERVGFSAGDKSVFFMSIRDFIKEFDYLVVGHYRDHWVTNSVNVTSDWKHFNYFELCVEKEIEAYVSVHQKPPQFVDEGPEYNISPVEIILTREIEGAYMENIAFGEQNSFYGKVAVYAQDGLESKLKPGRHIIAVKVKWVDRKNHDFQLNVLAPQAVKLSQIEKRSSPDFLEKVYLTAGMLSKAKFDMMNGCEFASGWAGSHLWICGFNRGNKTWHLEIVFDKMENMKIARKFRSQPNSIKIVLRPSQKAVAFAKRTKPEPVAMAWRFIQSWE